MSYYVHAVPGRLRVKIPAVKGNARLADDIRELLMSVRGVESAYANTLTGSVKVNHNPARLGSRDILAVLARQGYIEQGKTISLDDYFTAGAFRAGSFLGRTLFGVLMDQALAGSPLALLTILL